MFKQDYEFWKAAIQSAMDSGEIRSDLDLDDTAMMFRQVFFGLSFEQSFLRGLDTARPFLYGDEWEDDYHSVPLRKPSINIGYIS